MSNSKYTKEFKLETLSLAQEVGVTQASRRLGVGMSMIYSMFIAFA
ncbi:MAG: hypothetical protein IGS03_00740 [Candidatus Sericytochromatia bacterium]|nr:hypothetical protein [Candidatus Sericytochromatia bacterium]